MTELLESEGIPAEHGASSRTRCSGTASAGDIDAMSNTPGPSCSSPARGSTTDDSRLEALLAERGVAIAARLASTNLLLGMREVTPARSDPPDLGPAGASELKFGLSNEFVSRADGGRVCARLWSPSSQPRGLQHELAYRGIATRAIDVTTLFHDPDRVLQCGGSRTTSTISSIRRRHLYARLAQRRGAGAAPARRRARRGFDGLTQCRGQDRRRPAPAVAAAFLRERLGTDVTAAQDDRLRRFVIAASSICAWSNLARRGDPDRNPARDLAYLCRGWASRAGTTSTCRPFRHSRCSCS